MQSRMITCLLLLAGGLAACAARNDVGGASHDGRQFVETLGDDTVAVESFTRTDSSITGTVVSRNPKTSVVHYEAALGADGSIVRLDAAWHAGDALDVPPASRATITTDGEAAQIIRDRPEGTDTLDVHLEGALVPNLGRQPLATAMIEQATRQAAAAGETTMALSVLSPLGGRVSSNALERRQEGLYTLSYFGSPQLVSVDGEGTVRAISGRETTNRVEITESDSLDVMALAEDYAARDAAGEGLGVPSPTDTARATIDGAELEIVYSRPAMRGREIWGALVPYGEVWRTGANAATHLSTSLPIRLGEIDLPAGAYTLWSTFSADGDATLIVNSETGQWGTAYDAERDFGATALERRPLDQAVERFTIEFAEGELRLVWADRMYVAPIAVN